MWSEGDEGEEGGCWTPGRKLSRGKGRKRDGKGSCGASKVRLCLTKCKVPKYCNINTCTSYPIPVASILASKKIVVHPKRTRWGWLGCHFPHGHTAVAPGNTNLEGNKGIGDAEEEKAPTADRRSSGRGRENRGWRQFEISCRSFI